MVFTHFRRTMYSEYRFNQSQGENVKNILSLSCLSAALFLAPQIASAQCTVSTPTGAWGFSAQGFLSDTISLLPAVERASESRESKISLDLTTNDPFGEEGIIV